MTTTPKQASELPKLPEPLEIGWPQLHSVALGCGVEDRGLHNRYECAEYGWQEGVDSAASRVPDTIYDLETVLAIQRDAFEAGKRATQAADAVPVAILREIVALALEDGVAEAFGPHSLPGTSDAFDALIDKAAKEFASPTTAPAATTPAASESADTQDLRVLLNNHALATHFAEMNRDDSYAKRNLDEKIAAIVAHINAHTAAQVAASKPAHADDVIGEMQAEARQQKLDDFVAASKPATGEALTDARIAHLNKAADALKSVGWYCEDLTELRAIIAALKGGAA